MSKVWSENGRIYSRAECGLTFSHPAIDIVFAAPKPDNPKVAETIKAESETPSAEQINPLLKE